MIWNVIYTESAERDLQGIYDYIAVAFIGVACNTR